MKHLRQRARAICKKLSAKGFNGIRFYRAEIECDDGYEDYKDEMTYADFLKWKRDYAIFIAEPDIPYFNDDDSEYVEPREFSKDKFLSALKEYVQGEMGDDVAITYREGCSEFECIRQVVSP